MNHNIKSKKSIHKSLWMITALIISFTMFSCDDYFKFDLPESGSIEDLTPPSASFGATQSDVDFLVYNFANFSKSATDFEWDFGDPNSGADNTSTEVDGEHKYPAVGTYTITLKASDKNGKSSTYSETIEVVEPPEPEAIVPDIIEAGFEDNSLPDGTGDGRDSWRISGGKIFGISSDEYVGEQSAKFNAGDPRVAYQALTVTPNTDYIISFYYSMKDDNAGGKVRLAILGQAISDASEAEAAIIASAEGDKQEGSKTFNKLTLPFNSGATETIAIWIDSNNIAEARVDEVEIELVEQP